MVMVHTHDSTSIRLPGGVDRSGHKTMPFRATLRPRARDIVLSVVVVMSGSLHCLLPGLRLEAGLFAPQPGIQLEAGILSYCLFQDKAGRLSRWTGTSEPCTACLHLFYKHQSMLDGKLCLQLASRLRCRARIRQLVLCIMS